MWKVCNFSIPQILRYTNFEDSRGSKTAAFAIFGAMNFDDLVNFKFEKSSLKIHESQNSDPLNVLNWQILPF